MTQPHTARLAYSIEEATKLTSLGRSTLYILMSEGRLPYVQIGRRRLIRHDSLEQLLLDLELRRAG